MTNLRIPSGVVFGVVPVLARPTEAGRPVLLTGGRS
ncbi:hypothetical protein BCF44_105153 [Kutzneria buriramensis]|uniref:Uncharacterized protein n=1 Tax=Kutzneria buriramensis TaxID=1045776 RepID=A0A3E0HQM3_9PSEU|nr:hypothetical protein BCF44_105153 [Kutzneria buriramensis]